MDTESELAQDAATAHEPHGYSCLIKGCTSPSVEDSADLTPCENCRRRVCETHSRKRSCFHLCSDCDRKELDALYNIVLPELDKLSHRLRIRDITAEELQYKLSEIEVQASGIEGNAGI